MSLCERASDKIPFWKSRNTSQECERQGSKWVKRRSSIAFQNTDGVSINSFWIRFMFASRFRISYAQSTAVRLLFALSVSFLSFSLFFFLVCEHREKPIRKAKICEKTIISLFQKSRTHPQPKWRKNANKINKKQKIFENSKQWMEKVNLLLHRVIFFYRQHFSTRCDWKLRWILISACK